MNRLALFFIHRFYGYFILCTFQYYILIKYIILQDFIFSYLDKRCIASIGPVLLHRKIKKGIFVALSRSIRKGFQQRKRRHGFSRNGVF